MTADATAHATIEVGSNRSFGIVFAVVFALIGLYPLLFGGALRVWALGIAALFLVCAVAYPRALQPLNLLWFRFGMLLARIVNPVVMLVIYIVTIVPAGLIARLLRKDLLRLRFDSAASTYWIPRSPPGPEPESLKDQF